MTKKEKWEILRAMPVMTDEQWNTLVAILDAKIVESASKGRQDYVMKYHRV